MGRGVLARAYTRQGRLEQTARHSSIVLGYVQVATEPVIQTAFMAFGSWRCYMFSGANERLLLKLPSFLGESLVAMLSKLLDIILWERCGRNVSCFKGARSFRRTEFEVETNHNTN